MKFIRRWLWRSFAAVLVLVLAYVGVTAWSIKSSTPQLAGERRVTGLSAPVSIIRDAHGVPHIFGATAHDVYFALGYAHAQDRFFQMDISRRLVEGRLSELVGELGLRLDARARTEGFNHLIATQTKALEPSTRAMLAAYAEGVNARLKQGAPSPEYALLALRTEEWRPEDSVAVGLAMVNNLTVGDGAEIARTALAERLPLKRLNEFFPPYPDWAPRSIDDADLSVPAPASGASTADRPAPGSNAWVLGSGRTKTGKPILANDPHLDFTAPGPFYLVHLKLPDRNLIGATLPGAPLIVIGHNDHLAWSNTTNEIDSADLIPAPPGGFSDVRTRTETVVVRDFLWWTHRQDIKVRAAALGPLLDPAYFNIKAFAKRDVLLHSAALDPANRVVDALARMNEAISVDQFTAASAGWTAPMTHVLVASTDGDIGLVSTGALPLRDEAGVWTGSVPHVAQPNIKNPASGMIATANNLATPASYPYPMPGAFAVYRISRIRTLLDSGNSADVASAGVMQVDVVSQFAKRILPSLLTARPKTKAGQDALARLQSWDAAMAANKAEPLIFATWVNALSKAIYQDDIGADLFADYSGPRAAFLDSAINGANAEWCDDVTTTEVESCVALAGPALDEAVETLTKTYGADQSKWRWGAAHEAVFAHPLFGGMPVLGKYFDVRVPAGGDANTIFAGEYLGSDFQDRHGPSLRAIYDLADLNRSRFVVAPGQSGHPLSPHFKDLMGDWAAGKSFEIRADWDAAHPPAGSSTLTLNPR